MAQLRAMTDVDMEHPLADAECAPAERIPEEEIVLEGPIIHNIPEVRHLDENGREELSVMDLARLNPWRR